MPEKPPKRPTAGASTGLTPQRKSRALEDVASVDSMSDDAVEVIDQAPPWFKQFEARQNKRLDKITGQVNTLKGMIREMRQEVEEAKEAVNTISEKVEDLEIDVTNIRSDMELYVSSDSLKEQVEEIVKQTMADYRRGEGGMNGKGNMNARTGSTENVDEGRAMQVVVFGFKERTEPRTIEESLNTMLKGLLGDGCTAQVNALGDPAKVGMITFKSIADKIDFYKKVRNNPNKSIVGDLFFRNNLTRDERAKEKKLGYTKHHITHDGGELEDDVKILWRKDMVTVRGKKVAWFDEEGNWNVRTVAKRVEANIEESMNGWWKKIAPEPVTDSD